MQGEYYAHSLSNKPPEDWQSLEEHLKNVAEMARIFADPFGAGELGVSRGFVQNSSEENIKEVVLL